MSFFYDLNKKLDSIRATPEVTHQQLNERDMGKHNNATTGFKALADKTNDKIAGAQFQKMKDAGQLEEEGFPRIQAAIKKYTQDGVNKLAELGREGASKAKMDATRKEFNQYDNEEVDEGQDFGPGDAGPNGNQAGPAYSFSPDTKNYKTPNLDRNASSDDKGYMKDYNKEIVNTTMGPDTRGNQARIGATTSDGQGQKKYVNRTTPGVINKIKDKFGLDMPDPAYGPRPDERERLAKRYPAPGKSIDEDMYNQGSVYKEIEVEPKRPQQAEKGMTRGIPAPSKSAPKDNGMGRIVQGTWQADPKGKVPAPSGDPEGVKEAAKYRDPKYKDKLYTVEPLDYTYGPDADELYYNPKPDDYAGRKRKIGGGEFSHNDPLRKGFGRGGASNSINTHGKRKGMPSRDQISSLKGSIKDAHGTHAEPNLPEAGAPMTAKRKFTFADKIAGAKKEVDEMLGDVAAEAMRSALSPKQKKMAALGGNPERIDGPDLAALRKGAKMGEERSKGTAFDMSTPRIDTPKAGSTERGSKHDITHSTSDPRYKGRTVIRRTDAQGISVGSETDDEGNRKEKRTNAGRPDGTGKKIGAKGPSGKSKLITKVDEVDIRDQGEYDQEGDMAKDDIKTIMRHAQALSKVLGDNDNLPEWVQSKLAKIEGMMISIDEYMQNQDSDDGEEPIAEEPRSKNQAVAARIARGVQKGTAKAKPDSASAEMAKMPPKELNKFAKGSTKGLPKKVSKKKEVDENSEDGRLTTTQTGTGQTSTSSSTGRISATVDKGTVSVKPAKSGSMSYGKGIYDSFNRDLELMIAESMSINMSDSTEGNKSLTITATDEDAMKLAMMLKSAGIGGGQDHGEDFANQLQHAEHNHPGAAFGGEEVCDTCGMQDCGCGDVEQAIDENSPDWPTNTEQADNNFGYAGGLNSPKTDIAGDGQTTVPVVATRPHNDDLRRMMEMAGIRKEEHIDLGPTSPEVARMSKDEVNAALRSGMSPGVDLGPTSPEIAAMSKDEVDAALTLGLSPDISGMDTDSVNAQFGNSNDDTQYEDSIQRMREMAGIQEAKKDIDQNGDGKNDFEDIKIARMKASGAIKDKEEKKVDESIFALTNQWKAYKG